MDGHPAGSSVPVLLICLLVAAAAAGIVLLPAGRRRLRVAAVGGSREIERRPGLIGATAPAERVALERRAEAAERSRAPFAAPTPPSPDPIATAPDRLPVYVPARAAPPSSSLIRTATGTGWLRERGPQVALLLTALGGAARLLMRASGHHPRGRRR